MFPVEALLASTRSSVSFLSLLGLAVEHREVLRCAPLPARDFLQQVHVVDYGW